MSQKIAVNGCFGGFGLSHAAIMRYLELKGQRVWVEQEQPFPGLSHTNTVYWLVAPEERETRYDGIGEKWREMTQEQRERYNARCKVERFSEFDLHSDENRTDPVLIQVIEELGDAASGTHAALAIVTIPDGVAWHIHEYDGTEYVAENHRRWYIGGEEGGE